MDTLISRIAAHAKQRPDHPAVVFKKDILTYAGLYARIMGVALQLNKAGVRPGERVVFTALSKPETPVVYCAVQFVGAVSVYADKNGTPESYASLCESCGAALLLTDRPMRDVDPGCPVLSLRAVYQAAENAGELPYELPEPEKLAEMLFTSGTTGKPKGVMLSYRAVDRIAQNTMNGIGIRQDDRVLIPLPMHHSFALRVMRATMYAGGTVVLQNGFTFAKEIENNIKLLGCTGMACVPSSVELLRGQMQDAFVPVLSLLRYIEVGAGSLSVRQRRQLTRELPETEIFNTWGSSESGGAIFCNVREAAASDETVSALGKPIAGVTVQLLDPDGKPLEQTDAAHPGRMAIRGGMVMSGYWNNEIQTRDALRDGWLVTGDMVYSDANGYYYMLGRADDLINMGGEKVSPIEIENIACQAPYISECACIGAEDPDGLMGQIPVLFVVPSDSRYSEPELVQYLSARMERAKMPQRFPVLQALPRNRMQKIDRRQLRQIWENRGSLDLMNPVMQALLMRRSIRHFTADAVPGDILDMILKAGCHAPSGHNMQTWRFTVLRTRKNILRLKEAAREAAMRAGVHFYGFEEPACVILVSNDERNPDGCQDASCAAENMMIAAQSYGLGSVWLNPLVSLRHAEPVGEILDEFGVPANHIVWATVALGYPAAEGVRLAKNKDVIHMVDSEDGEA